MDTVAAGHLSLYGYDRPTSPTIDELAARGVRFDRAQATSSWTLPSHASMFTGRWPHELSDRLAHAPRRDLIPPWPSFWAHGYATAGFTANYWYCASNSGLGSRFYRLSRLYLPAARPRSRSAVLVEPLRWTGSKPVERFLEEWLDLDFLRPAVEASAGSSREIEKRRPSSIASSSTGSHRGGGRSGPSSRS